MIYIESFRSDGCMENMAIIREITYWRCWDVERKASVFSWECQEEVLRFSGLPKIRFRFRLRRVQELDHWSRGIVMIFCFWKLVFDKSNPQKSKNGKVMPGITQFDIRRRVFLLIVKKFYISDVASFKILNFQ